MRKNKNMSKIIASLIIAVGIIISASLVSNSFLKAKLLNRTVVVKGLAEKEVSADFAIWPITIAATGNNLSEINKKIEADRAILISFLVNQGLNQEDISLGNYQLNDLMINSYRDSNIQNSRYIINATIILKSKDVYLVDKVSKQKNLIIQKGIIFGTDGNNNGEPYYEYTKFNDIKPEMLTEAIKNARLSAERFANDSGSKVGQLKKANQGIFSISPALQTSSDDYLNTQMALKSIKKKIRVVTTLEYFLD
jgi:hypothetical protein